MRCLPSRRLSSGEDLDGDGSSRPECPSSQRGSRVVVEDGSSGELLEAVGSANVVDVGW